MAAMTPLRITLFARIGESEVLNDIGTIDIDATVEPFTPENRPEHAAVEAVASVSIDIPKMLRDAADEYERQHRMTPHEIAQDALARREADLAGR
ncbi:hypothetical protein QDA02_gp05 [Microbacterium phage Margaery]|uniref:Uncharacterized protein n=1 Tax=Microbacterium phage Margaery TaxID=2591217 RepID=A0A514DHI3_9CAUD|nr:hypothetical protein QDA02_gp05 [Microbacterium phage Margaery]QDH93063.1 hypothetical protein PBI_MARGAERY_5 [Microbacterium phage Margaery]